MTKPELLLVGNPNCGKTTLFNLLTGLHQRVGNWAGVTVDNKRGAYIYENDCYTICDLPGCYSLVSLQQMAGDEKVTCCTLLQRQEECVINVVDACNLNRDLYLTHQLLELKIPMLVVVNCVDKAFERGIHIDFKELSQHLGCAVVPMVAKDGEGLDTLKHAIQVLTELPKAPKAELTPPDFIVQYIQLWGHLFTHFNPSLDSQALAIRALEGDKQCQQYLEQQGQKPRFIQTCESLSQETEQALDVALAMWRHHQIRQWLGTVVSIPESKAASKQTRSALIDQFVLNRFLGIPIFFIVMYSMFFFAISFGGVFQPFFELMSQAVFMDAPRQALTYFNTAPWMIDLLCDGLGKGINVTCSFIPVLAGMYFFLSFLEGSGYLARAAFVMDRFMRILGLPGKSFVPMIIGFGCNVPAVMGARTLENRHERILTIMMTPFMSCSARLAIYAVFVSAFFAEMGQNIIFALYLVGVGIAVLTGFILKGVLLEGTESPFVMELPAYQFPPVKGLVRQTKHRLKMFVKKAGSLIIPLCMVLASLGLMNPEKNVSYLESMGRKVSVVFQPIGIEKDNWPAAVGLLSGVMAKEVVVGTLNALYSQQNDAPVKMPHFKETMQEAFTSVKERLFGLREAIKNPLVAHASDEDLALGVMGTMVERFQGPIAAFAYLLFVLLYFPCVSVIASIAKELSWRWGLFAMGWTTGLAYLVAMLFYQCATLPAHPRQSLMWILSGLIFFIGAVYFIRKTTLRMKQQRRRRAIPTQILLTTDA